MDIQVDYDFLHFRGLVAGGGDDTGGNVPCIKSSVSIEEPAGFPTSLFLYSTLLIMFHGNLSEVREAFDDLGNNLHAIQNAQHEDGAAIPVELQTCSEVHDAPSVDDMGKILTFM